MLHFFYGGVQYITDGFCVDCGASQAQISGDFETICRMSRANLSNINDSVGDAENSSIILN